jgi:nicotinamide phosphoribosyltransferase
VIDGYDTLKAVKFIGTKYKDVILNSGIKLVFRPDSGNPSTVTLDVVHLLDSLFGSTTNTKGYKQLHPQVGVLWGDGIDRDGVQSILTTLEMHGYAASNLVFGSGGGLLQKVNRDTNKFAQKASAALFDGDDEWKDVYKEPATDKGKSSKKGRLSLFKSRLTGEFATIRLDDGPIDSEWEEMLIPIWEHGVLLKEWTLDEVRARANAE